MLRQQRLRQEHKRDGKSKSSHHTHNVSLTSIHESEKHTHNHTFRRSTIHCDMCSHALHDCSNVHRMCASVYVIFEFEKSDIIMGMFILMLSILFGKSVQMTV